ncbi:MAG: DUF1178 family protein [Pseudomonadota bacterium]
MKCGRDHAFDGWFRSSADFERQQDAGMLSCPVCGTHDVSRALMAPAVRTSPAAVPAQVAEPVSDNAPEQPSAETAPATPAPTVPTHAALSNQQKQKFFEAVRALRKAIVQQSDNVGRSFPEEARRIHYGESEARGIYGQASEDEAKALVEEGIEVLPIPILPEDRN